MPVGRQGISDFEKRKEKFFILFVAKILGNFCFFVDFLFFKV